MMLFLLQVASVTVIHLPDDKYSLSARILFQYLLTSQGTMFELKVRPGFAIWNLSGGKSHAENQQNGASQRGGVWETSNVFPSCSPSSCQLIARKQLGLLTPSRAPRPANPPRTPAECSRVQRWRRRCRRRTGQSGRAETAWCVRTQRWTGSCCPADTPVCATAACHTSSTAPSAGRSSSSRSLWHRDQLQNNSTLSLSEESKPCNLNSILDLFWQHGFIGAKIITWIVEMNDHGKIRVLGTASSKLLAADLA